MHAQVAPTINSNSEARSEYEETAAAAENGWQPRVSPYPQSSSAGSIMKPVG
jgi:hypothetical protein